jgi:DNA-binding response OmpR family regulator
VARVLVVEDQSALQQSLRRGLSEAGYAVIAARTARDALNSALVETPDLILLDRMLPDGDGLDVAQALRRSGFLKPILMVTALDTVHDRITGLDGGADDYLIKPFAFGELLARVRSLLRRSVDQTTALEVDDLRLDVRQRQATRAGRRVELTQRQTDVLEYLMLHAYQPVSREVLAREVWKQDTATWTNVIEVHINQLRKRIEAPELPPILQTIRGQGYRLGTGS